MALSKLALSVRYSHKATDVVKIGKKYNLTARIFTIQKQPPEVFH